MENNITYEIVKHLGKISENSKGWSKEVNIIKWNNGNPKYDIRDWAPDREKMGKGITLNEDEIYNLKEILKNI